MCAAVVSTGLSEVAASATSLQDSCLLCRSRQLGVPLYTLRQGPCRQCCLLHTGSLLVVCMHLPSWSPCCCGVLYCKGSQLKAHVCVLLWDLYRRCCLPQIDEPLGARFLAVCALAVLCRQFWCGLSVVWLGNPHHSQPPLVFHILVFVAQRLGTVLPTVATLATLVTAIMIVTRTWSSAGGPQGEFLAAFLSPRS